MDRGSDYLDNLDLTAEIDGEKLYGVKGSRIFIYALNNYGAQFNSKRVGSGEGLNNIEVDTPSYKLYEAWIEQNFWDDYLSLRAGLYDLNSEFNATESSSVFINPTFGIDTAYGSTGENGPSIFPTTSLGLRTAIHPTKDFYVQFAVLDGVPGDPDHPRGTHINLGHSDGALLAAETGYGTVADGRMAIGGWHYTQQQPDLASGDQKHNNGWYAMLEKTLYAPTDDRHLDGFIRFANASDAVNPYDYSGSIGVSYTGPFASRPNDTAGLAWHGAHLSDSARAADPSLVETGEWGVEATYAYAATGWLTLQPDLQYIHNPGSTTVDDAIVSTIRLGVVF